MVHVYRFHNSKLNAFAILRDHSLIWKSFVGAHVNTAGVTIDAVDKVSRPLGPSSIIR